MRTLQLMLKEIQHKAKPFNMSDWRTNPKEGDPCWTVTADGTVEKILCEPKFRKFYSNYPYRIFLTEKDAEYFAKRRMEYELALINELYGLQKQLDLFEGTSQMEALT